MKGRLLLLLLLINLCITAKWGIANKKKKNHLKEEIQLDPPIKTGGMPLYEAMKNRESRRDFVDGADLSMAELSQLLWATYGPNRQDGKKTAPSSKAKYPFDIYVFLKYGTYLYKPDDNVLELINKEDLRAITGKQDFVKDAFVNFAFVGVLEREAYLPESLRRDACDIDSGNSIMNAYLYCASADIKCVVRGNFDQDKILNALGLDNVNYYIPLCFSAGK